MIRKELEQKVREGADLRKANLRGANLRYANLRYANLRRADLLDADLRGADLRRADLLDADLRGADLGGADLRGANLLDADLRGADLGGADLRGANLRGADLGGADLGGADLRGADLRGADLGGADLTNARLPHFQIPQDGELIVWKTAGRALIKLRIPADAKRTASLVGRKCRAEKAEVLWISDDLMWTRGAYDPDMIYRVGETVIPDSYDPDPRIECTHGIHFFLTKEEAAEWGNITIEEA